MPPDQLQKQLALLTTAVSKSKAPDALQDALDSQQQLVESISAESIHPLGLTSLAPSLAPSLLTLLRSGSAVTTSALGLISGVFQKLLKLLEEVYSSDEGGERFVEGKQDEGEALEGVVEALLRGLKSYVGAVEKLSKEALTQVGKHCYRSIAAVICTKKAKAVLHRKTLDIFDYTISHHAANKALLLSSDLLGPTRLGSLIVSLLDYGVSERAMELAYRLRESLLMDSTAGTKKEREERASKWDQALWKGLGAGKEKDEVLRKWRSTKKTSYAEDSAELLGVLSAGDLAHFQLVHALTLSANGRNFVEDSDAPPSASFDQAVAFNHSTFTASTTHYITDDDPVAEVLELDLSSIERVQLQKQGQDMVSIRIVSLHPPTLESKAMPLSDVDSEHHIAFTIREKDRKQLVKVLTARQLLFESIDKPSSCQPTSTSLPTPVKSPQQAAPAVAKRKPSKSQRNAAKVVGTALALSAQPSNSKEVAIKKPAQSKQAVVEIPVKVDQVEALANKTEDKASAAAPNRSVPKATAKRPPRPRPVPSPAAVALRSPIVLKEKGRENDAGVHNSGGRPGQTKRKVAAEGERGIEAFPWATEEVGHAKEEPRKRQKVSEVGLKEGRSVAFEFGADKSPLQQRIDTLSKSPRRAIHPPAAGLRRRRSVEAGPSVLAPNADSIGLDDSGYVTGGVLNDEWQMDVDAHDEGESADDEEEDDELLNTLSQIMQTGSARERRKVVELLKQGAGVASSDVENADEDALVSDAEVVQPNLLVKSPAQADANLAGREHLFPGVAAPDQPVPVRFSPVKLFQRRTRPSLHRQPLLQKSDLRAEKGEAAGVGRKGKEKPSRKHRDSPRPRKTARASADTSAAAQAINSVDPEQEQLRKTLMQLSEVVLHNYTHRRESARLSFGGSRRRIVQHATKLTKVFNDQTRAIADHAQKQVKLVQSASTKLQELKERSKGSALSCEGR